MASTAAIFRAFKSHIPNMKFSLLVAFTLGSALTVNSLIIPESVRSVSLPEGTFGRRDTLYADLERRKGGGGGGHGGGGSSGGKGGSTFSSSNILATQN